MTRSAPSRRRLTFTALGLVCALAACGADGPPVPKGGGPSPVAFQKRGPTVSMTGDVTLGMVTRN